MSFYDVNMLTKLSSHFNEQEWVRIIHQTLDQEFEEDAEVAVTIFAVPKPLMVIDPHLYTPQQLAIGPYHQLRPELYEMQRYKVAAARRNQKELEGIKLKAFVDRLIEYELQIRASYHRPLNYGSESLAWMMTLDASFLFEFFQVCGIKKGKALTKAQSRLAYLTNLSGNKTARNIILRDITLLENQIPLFVLRMLLEFHLSSVSFADEVLLDMLIDVGKELCPFMMAAPCRKVEVKDCAHFLDCLYHFIVPEFEGVDETIDILEMEGDGKTDEVKIDSVSHSRLRRLLDEIWKFLRRVKNGPVDWMFKKVKVVVKLPWMMISKIPILKAFKGPVEKMLGIFFHKDKKEEEEEEGSSSIQKPPVLEEITIPSVTQLAEVGVQFLPTNEGIAGIAFDTKTGVFHMPVVELDVNSDVVLRNLVAFEACSAAGPLVLGRYTEMMNGIVDTEKDAEILCQKGIIINHLKSEKEVADVWNGMSKSINITKVPSLDKVIREVNVYYNGRWKVRCKRIMQKYVFGSWQILTFLAAIILLLLMCLQAFCQVYTCSRFFHVSALEPND